MKPQPSGGRWGRFKPWPTDTFPSPEISPGSFTRKNVPFSILDFVSLLYLFLNYFLKIPLDNMANQQTEDNQQKENIIIYFFQCFIHSEFCPESKCKNLSGKYNWLAWSMHRQGLRTQTINLASFCLLDNTNK